MTSLDNAHTPTLQLPQPQQKIKIHPSKFKDIASTTVSYNGYSIRKADLSPHIIAKLRDILTVSPKTCPGYGPDTQTIFKIYKENDKKIYLPRAYGYKHIGIPKRNKLPPGMAIDCNFKGELREYQMDVLKAWNETAIKCGGGAIISIGAGRGKTVTAIAQIAKLKLKTLILVHTSDLLNQWLERLEQYLPDAKLGIIRGKNIQTTCKDVVIGMIQSLSNPLKDKEYPVSLFKDFGFVIIDECHHIAAETFSRCLQKTSFRYMMGLSATPDRMDGLTKVFKYYMGDICFKDEGIQKTEEEKLLNHIPDADVRIYEYLNYSLDYCNEIFNYQKRPNTVVMESAIANFMPRTLFILSLLPDLIREGRKIIIITSRRDHVKILLEEIIRLDIGTCGPYAGGIKEKILADSKTKQILVATYKMVEEGFDHQELNTLIMATPKSRIIQTIGRIMRKKKNDRTFIPLVIDVVDMFSSFNSWANKRLKYYQKLNYRIAKYNVNETKPAEGRIITCTQPPVWVNPDSSYNANVASKTTGVVYNLSGD